MRSTRSGHARPGFSLEDLIWLLLMLFVLFVILLPSLSRSRHLAKQAVCASNLRGLGQGLYIYANDNEEWFPHHYYEPTYAKTRELPLRHGIHWVGTMGSNDFLRISDPTNKEVSPKRSHPSRSLFLLITHGIVHRSGRCTIPCASS